MRRRQHGFTLIEVMIVTAIIAILAAIAIPSYSEYILRSRVTDGIGGLAGMRVKMEQYFQDNRTYVGACVAGTIAPLPTANNFTYACSGLTASAYLVTATGTGPMSGFTYTINEANTRATTATAGWGTNATCWVLTKSGSC